MGNRSTVIALCGALATCVSLTAVASITAARAQESAAMKACSEQWNKMKEAGKVPKGRTWPQFWSECSKEQAAKQEGTKAEPTKAEPTKAEPAKTEPKKAAVKTVEVEDEADTAGSGAQKKECDAKWKDRKAKTGEHGWKPYFTFMAKCM
jgi:hypothetical protein